MARVFVPYPMRKLVGGASWVQVEGSTLGEVIANLERMHPGTRERIMDGDRIRPGLAAIVGQQPTRQGLRHKVSDDTEIHFLPQISGGDPRRSLPES